MAEYKLVERCPTVEEFFWLREAVGWKNIAPEAAERGLRNSLFGVCLYYGEDLIGCGRVLGDGGIVFYIADIIVSPVHQSQGQGKMIMEAIMNYIKLNAVPGAFVGLMAAKGAEGFYTKLGFITRPSDKYGPGMCMWLK